MSPLYDAAQGGHLKVIKLLVKKGANIHYASDEGVTPLHVAALQGRQEVVDYLMSKGSTCEATGTLAKACMCFGAADASLKCGLCLTLAARHVRRGTGRRGARTGTRSNQCEVYGEVQEGDRGADAKVWNAGQCCGLQRGGGA
jgi:ankyrin repeat protein